MKRWSFLVTFFLSQILPGIAQPNTLSPENPKFQKILEVYETLARSWETFKPAPKLEVYSSQQTERYLAQYIYSDLGNSRILLDEEIYDLCVKRFGPKYPDALACILGHELAHHYRYHKASPGFLREEATDTLEQEADYFGLFQAYVAGFESYTIFPEVLDLIYGSYFPNISSEKVVPKAQRIKQAEERVEALIPVIELTRTGNTLLLAEKYSLAEACFESALEVLPSKELFNNLGLSILLDVSSQLDLREMGFSYPFEIAPVQRLEKGLGRGLVSSSASRDAYVQKRLSKAIDYFEKAHTIDPLYSPAQVNLAASLILQGYPDLALAELRAFQRTSEIEKVPLPENALTIGGIAAFEHGDLELAGEKFKAAYERNALHSGYNLKLFNASTEASFSWAGWRDQLMEEMKSWGNYIRSILYETPEDPTPATKPDRAISPIAWNDLPPLNNQLHGGSVISSPNGSGRLYSYDTLGIRTHRLLYPEEGPTQQNYVFEFMYTLSLEEHSRETEQQLARNATTTAVIEVYGHPTRQVASPNGSLFYIYALSRPDRGMIFEFEKNSLTGWTVFRNRPFFF